jgi:hypothetical protein
MDGKPAGSSPDHVFRFPIVPETSETRDPLTDMIKTFVEGLLEIGCFTRKGREVSVDGFRLNGRKTVTPVAPARRRTNR